MWRNSIYVRTNSIDVWRIFSLSSQVVLGSLSFLVARLGLVLGEIRASSRLGLVSVFVLVQLAVSVSWLCADGSDYGENKVGRLGLRLGKCNC